MTPAGRGGSRRRIGPPPRPALLPALSLVAIGLAAGLIVAVLGGVNSEGLGLPSAGVLHGGHAGTTSSAAGGLLLPPATFVVPKPSVFSADDGSASASDGSSAGDSTATTSGDATPTSLEVSHGTTTTTQAIGLAGSSSLPGGTSGDSGQGGDSGDGSGTTTTTVSSGSTTTSEPGDHAARGG